MTFISGFLMACGCVLMTWGTLYLLTDKPFVTKLHALGISDTLGSLLIVAGLILRFPDRIVMLGAAFLALLFWGPLLTYILAKGVSRGREWGEQR